LSPETGTLRVLRILTAALLLLAAGCRQNMHNQHKVRTLAASDFFPDGQGARPIPAHTVARGDLREGWAYTGLDAANKPAVQLPFPLTREVLLRGEERFNIFCSPCHDRQGTGRGMIVQRGYKQPTSYHVERLRNAPVGYFYNVITEGFGVMPSYAPQIPVADRWAIAAYIRVLQYRQTAKLADLDGLSPERRQAIQSDLAKPPSPQQPAGPQLAPGGSNRGRSKVP
jgi:mono/diheme cytochrome c family protein